MELMETARVQPAVRRVKCDKWGRACFFEVSTIMLSGLRRPKQSPCAAESQSTAAQRIKFEEKKNKNCGERKGRGWLSCSGMQKR